MIIRFGELPSMRLCSALRLLILITLIQGKYFDGKCLFVSPLRVLSILFVSPSHLFFCIHQFQSLFEPESRKEQVMFEFWHYSTMIGENFEYCTSQMSKNASGGGNYCIFKFQICLPQAEFTNLIS